jgi:hypothetical protein
VLPKTSRTMKSTMISSVVPKLMGTPFRTLGSGAREVLGVSGAERESGREYRE